MAEKQTLRMVLPRTELSAFFPLLQRGVWVQVQVGCGVMRLLADQFGVAEDYVVERITTLFLNGKPIDDLETSYVNDGSTLALSAAMPGLVGATMRRGGHLAAMRETISLYNQQPVQSGTGCIKIKLFNMVMAELGATFLSHGICLSNGELLNFFNEQEESFWNSFGDIILGEQPMDSAHLKKHLYLADPTDEMLVAVEFKD
ncbi:MAG: hypothetical protein JXQ81_05410 [Desulfuromonadales bacterium]|nr:hypothetical protein [Desulfuromonadales bacterium]